MNGDHSAVLANFRLASFLSESEVNTGVPASECDPWSVRWLAPELLFPEKFGLDGARRTKETDVYGFAMVMFEVGPLSIFPISWVGRLTFGYVNSTASQTFSGSFPFGRLRNEALILLVRSGDHPRRPKVGSDLGLTDELWDMMKACWNRRDRRWKISRIASTLERHSATAAAEMKRHPQRVGRGSEEALIQSTREGNLGRHPRRTRWVFGISSHKRVTPPIM